MSDESPGAEEPEQSAAERFRGALAPFKNRRVVVVLVAVGLVWLGVWTYTSGSAATGSVGPVSTLSAAPPTTHGGARAGRHKNKNKKTKDTTPPADLAKTPQAYATALFGDWVVRDRAEALRVADVIAVKQLFARQAHKKDHWVAQGCHAGGATTACTWVTPERTVVLEVRNATASEPLRVVAAVVTP